MPDIKLPDGKKVPFSKTIDGFEIARKISKSLAKKGGTRLGRAEASDECIGVGYGATQGLDVW